MLDSINRHAGQPTLPCWTLQAVLRFAASIAPADSEHESEIVRPETSGSGAFIALTIGSARYSMALVATRCRLSYSFTLVDDMPYSSELHSGMIPRHQKRTIPRLLSSQLVREDISLLTAGVRRAVH